MRTRRILSGLILSVLISVLFLATVTGMAVANVPGVALNAPPPPPAPNVPVQGGEGLVKVIVSHRDTMIPATHYVDHVYLFDGNNLLREWKYTEADANPNELYTEAVVIPATRDMNLKAIAHCTLHGYSSANVLVTVLPSGTTPAQMVSMNANNAGMQINGIADPAQAANMINTQDAALIKQLQSNEMNNIQKHQMQTKQFFQTDQGQQFLQQFDFSKRQGMAQQGQQPGMMQQPGMQQAMAQQGQQQAAMQQPGAERTRMQQRGMQDMQQGMAQQGQQQAMQQPGMQQGMAGISGTGRQILEKSRTPGIPQTVWTDSMGNMIDGRQAMQLGKAAEQQQMGMQQGARQAGTQQPGMMQQPGAMQQPGMQQAGMQQQGVQQAGMQQAGMA